MGVPMARGGPLNPLDFASLGTFPTTAGTYMINTSGIPTLTGPGGTSITGVVSNGVAVFDFDSINVASGQEFDGTGSLPVALLSRDAITVGGRINVSAGLSSPLGSPGPGGYPIVFGGGPGGGRAGGITSFSTGSPLGTTTLYGGSGGGGFGGTGGAGGTTNWPATPVSPPMSAPGGVGGGGYGNLLLQLQGGGGGGPGFTNVFGYFPGGGGGGAIELGAIANISVSGSILADGFGSYPPYFLGAGGGSGGGILLDGDGVTLTGLLSAHGGDGDAGGGYSLGKGGGSVGGGGGGGGGEVVFDPRPGVFADIGGTIDVSGGTGGSGGFGPDGTAGGAGVVNVVPEPSSLILLAMAVPAVGYALRRRKPGQEPARNA